MEAPDVTWEAEPARTPRRLRVVGYVFGAFAALSWATSPILIERGLMTVPPLWGVAVGLASATLAILLWERLGSRNGYAGGAARKAEPGMRAATRFLVLAGALSAFGGIARTLAIDNAPIVIALPLTQTASFFTLVFAWIFIGRRVEQIGLRLVAGVVLIAVGSTLVVLGQHR
jgi:drug/metabolite transporter (DMT)-like permease